MTAFLEELHPMQNDVNWIIWSNGRVEEMCVSIKSYHQDEKTTHTVGLGS